MGLPPDVFLLDYHSILRLVSFIGDYKISLAGLDFLEGFKKFDVLLMESLVVHFGRLRFENDQAILINGLSTNTFNITSGDFEFIKDGNQIQIKKEKDADY